MSHIVIAGAGLAGSLAAVYLAGRGHEVRVVERRPDPRTSTPDGRSINLGLSQRGITALREVGLLDELWGRTTPMRGRMVHTDAGTSFHPYGTADDEILHSILRDDLNAALIGRAEADGVRFDFEHKVVALDRSLPVLTVHDGQFTHELKADLVLGADGAFSTVRTLLHRGTRAELHQEFMDWGYKEITVPANPDTRLEALHLWPGRAGLVVAHPNHDGTLTATVFLPFDGDDSFAELTTPSAVRRLFATQFADLASLVPDLVEQFLAHPTGNLVTIRTAPWQHEGRVVLLGDAAHAVYPFYGQGMNAAFEDCSVLDTCLAEHDDIPGALREFERRRRRHTDVLAALSKENFLELRDGMRSPLFLARKKADLLLHKAFPNTWRPLYTMIAHTTTPYADALARARRQDRALAAAAVTVAGTVVAALARSRRQVPGR
ncbi:FAD-dependent oxidoreductase [Actinophytocola gossypii]|uniref:FAD-dependent monooxygenase n=1 Tax=Actinophytocola gossypii TaxID=2812003 RepID=A0ABT2J4S1_9PSEU|nr:NAD(P)/FAD-dependent oxidoreductase [Actinophytocola gossypii]MCT2582861.1 FAD-dependent monooxygenase [Actinophytocola gossypii]